MSKHEKINYVEFPATDIVATKAFFESAFSWTFVDYGPDYTAFFGQGLDGGFFRSELSASSEHGSALVVFYSEALEQTLEKIEKSGGAVVKSVFPFPGGRRFQLYAASCRTGRSRDDDN